ncbi:PP2C family protein-serine/threonine phosphatase [Helicovermis profundi]|uniref:Stage 0 sporulation protein A homolog n=1 Tax=Helicovermis profundi TaxID=3065157 RepID=A0AAU9ECZ0_9FIRM|nr:SpoIIE family protein phosphatase [Clostridia bacterium S502]
MGYNIIIADDVRMNRVLLIEILDKKLKDLVFFEAENGIEVVKLCDDFDIDLVILDLIMPVQDGYETLKKLKLNEKTTDIPIIVNSAISDVASIEKTLEDGAIDYFTKPLSKYDMQVMLPLKAKNALLLYEHKKTIENLNKTLNGELKNANAFQNIMLPKNKNFRNLDLYIKFQPSMGIGGDCFDCFEKDGKIWFIIADVTGHGIAAGMASSMVKVMFRSNANLKDTSPSEILENMNNSIFDMFDFEGEFNYIVFSAFVGLIDDDVFTYSNAGQPYPIVISEEEEVTPLNKNGLLLGILEGIGYENYEMKLNRGDEIFVYTDGLFSSGKDSDFKNWTLVEEFTNLYKRLALEDQKTFLEKAFNHFKLIHMTEDGDYTDDVAMMLLRLK